MSADQFKNELYRQNQELFDTAAEARRQALLLLKEFNSKK